MEEDLLWLLARGFEVKVEAHIQILPLKVYAIVEDPQGRTRVTGIGQAVTVKGSIAEATRNAFEAAATQVRAMLDAVPATQ